MGRKVRGRERILIRGGKFFPGQKGKAGERIPPPNPYALQISKTVPVQVKRIKYILLS
jgi:hypothetical protein